MVKKIIIGSVVVAIAVIAIFLLDFFYSDKTALGTIVEIGAEGELTLIKTSKGSMSTEKWHNDLQAFIDLTSSSIRPEDSVESREDLADLTIQETDIFMVSDLSAFEIDEQVISAFISQYTNLLSFVEENFSTKNIDVKEVLINEIERRKDLILEGNITSSLPLFSTLEFSSVSFGGENGNQIIEGIVYRYVYQSPNKGLKNELGPGVVLSGKNLSSSIMWQIDLSGSDFSGSLLRHNILTESNLSGVNFNSSNLSGVIFGSTVGKEANFKDANLQGAVFFGDDFTDAYFEGTDFRNASFYSNGTEKTRINIEWKDAILKNGINGEENISWVSNQSS